MTERIHIAGNGNVVVTGNANCVLAGGGRRRNAVLAGEGLALFPVRLPRSIRRRVAVWAVAHGLPFEDALAELAKRQLDAET